MRRHIVDLSTRVKEKSIGSQSQASGPSQALFHLAVPPVWGNCKVTDAPDNEMTLYGADVALRREVRVLRRAENSRRLKGE